jgi:hypothetical protein
MFKFLQSIFKVGQTKGSYPESLVNKAIERAVDGTDPLLRAVLGYKKKLRPAVRVAIDHVISLVDGLPAPKPISLESRGYDPLIRALFISVDEMRKVFGKDRNIADFLRGVSVVPEKITALLVMEKNEKVIYRAEMSGDVVERELPRKHIGFEAHRLIDPSGDEGETRRLLKVRAYDHLVSLALNRITTMKAEREDLKQYRTLFQTKLNILRQAGWGFEAVGYVDGTDISEMEEMIGRIEAQLKERGGADQMLKTYLDILVDVLGRPEEHLWEKKETMILDSMGIRCEQVSSNASELTFNELFNSEGRSLVVLPVALNGGEIRSICG